MIIKKLILEKAYFILNIKGVIEQNRKKDFESQ